MSNTSFTPDAQNMYRRQRALLKAIRKLCKTEKKRRKSLSSSKSPSSSGSNLAPPPLPATDYGRYA